MKRSSFSAIGLWLAVLATGSSAAEMAIRHEADRLVITDASGGPVAVFVFADSRVGRPAIKEG
jgi:hypothetical protein